METAEEVNAKKTRLNGDAALKLLTGVKHLYVAKGKRVVHLDLSQETPDDGELTKLLLGPTGNLRAPTVRKGQTLVVGFHQGVYDRVIG